jgi:hypothetical protein
LQPSRRNEYQRSSQRFGSPWQRAYVERIIGSIRRECLDHVIILNEESLRHTLRSYFSYYHRSRLHLSLKRDSPDSRPVQSIGRIVALPEVGGLHHRYDRRITSRSDLGFQTQSLCFP